MAGDRNRPDTGTSPVFATTHWSEKGKFRSFLLAALRRFLFDQWDRARAGKRGGGAQLVSLDAQEAEERYRELLRGEIARTAASPTEIGAEIRCLIAVVAS